MIDEFEISSAFRQVLTDIKASDFAKLELVIVNRPPQPLPPARAAGKLSRYLRLLRDPERRPFLLYALFQKFDQRHLGDDPNPLENVDCADLLGACPRLDVTPVTKRFVHRFPPDAVARLRSYDLDVMLRFGFNILRGAVLTSAR